ncbi:MAG: M67 family metallopeptidase [Candidatus Omnitrophica bacterium]|nr:M67 family metallopeptidase [Candidatus Omnitrophota bacterium]
MGKLTLPKFPLAILKALKGQAEKEYPNECCGMMLASKDFPDKILEIRPCRNVQNEYHGKDPENFPRTAQTAYFMEPGELLAIQKEIRGQGLMIRVIYHSHIDTGAYFSEEDKRMALAGTGPAYPEADYLIISVRGGQTDHMNLFHWDAGKKDFVL